MVEVNTKKFLGEKEMDFVMKKKFTAMLMAAMAVGATSTTFAAANPFEDVAADHWAYDAVAQLAADGVIEGYGDGTFRGEQEITRYEMAQMVARAMAKSGVSAADKAMIDKLAAEFADELNALGVRVAALEKKVDNVKWTGRVRYRYISQRMENDGMYPGSDVSLKNHTNTNQVLLRLEPTMTINKHWTGKARIDYGKSDNMDTAKNDTTATVDRIYVEGKYGDTVIDLGKFPHATAADYGMSFDYKVAGGKVTFGRDVKAAVTIGRIKLTEMKAFRTGYWNLLDVMLEDAGMGEEDLPFGTTASYQAIEVYNDRDKKFTWGVGFQRVKNTLYLSAMNAMMMVKKPVDDIKIWNVGLGYKFTPTFNMTAAYARQNDLDFGEDEVGYEPNYSWAVQANYKGAKPNDKGSFGLFLAYRVLGPYATIHSTYRENGAMESGQRGWEIGASYTFDKNIMGKAQYFIGKDMFPGITDKNVRGIWTELSFLF